MDVEDQDDGPAEVNEPSGQVSGDHLSVTLTTVPSGLTPTQDMDNGNDSDISMSSDSDSDSDTSDSSGGDTAPIAEAEQQPISNEAAHIQDTMDTTSRKRKSPGMDTPEPEDELPTSDVYKKARLDAGTELPSNSSAQVLDKSLLAPEVNKLFYHYLNPSSPAQISMPSSAPEGVLTILKPYAIWHASRRLFWPKMPTPLRSMSELDMWRLLCSTQCQECYKSGTHDVGFPADYLHNGPGLEGVSLIWPFGIRVCGPCLLKKATKEIDVLLSSTVPSTLIPALPFVHITKDLHTVSLSTIEQGQLPPNVQVTKLFLTLDVQEIKQEFISVRTLGPGTTEEWLKGLESRGQQCLGEWRKWEKWAAAGKLQLVRNVTDPFASSNSAVSGPCSLATGTVIREEHTTKSVPHARQERTLEEAAQLKAARRAEIERRASQLNPPLTPTVLRHMVSFQAAIQLITELDDSAWDLLRPRLLAEKSDAEDMERKVAAQIRMIQGQDRPSHIEATLATTKEAKDAIDKDWEEVQAPLRARIVGYVDDFIRSWDKGKSVKVDNCSRFAAEALVHIRKQFYAQVAKDAEAARAAGREPVVDSSEGPFTQKLTLENMRWIFDTKIKPITAPLKKELFFCNGCTAKPFGFEGVVQHYAAKHTDRLSSGNIVVHWRAEWPEVPPFNPEGRTKIVLPAPGTVPPYSFPAPPSVTPSNQPFAQPPGPAFGAPPYAEHQQVFQYPPYPSAPSYAPSPATIPPQPYAPPPGWGQYQNGPLPAGPYAHNPAPPQLGGYQPPIAPIPTPSVVPGPYNFGPTSHPTAAPGYAAPQAPYSIQLEDVVRNSREIWNATANMRDLPGSARIFVTIYHAVKRFRARFSETPTLALFQDGLSNHKDMRPVRNINTLVCKACQLGLGNAPYIQEDRKSFSLPQLVNHFQSKHVEAMQTQEPNAPPLDWTVDMVLLPGQAILAKLRSAVGSDSLKYQLFSEAFPEVFTHATSTPANPYYAQPPQQHTPYQPETQYAAAILPPAVDNHGRFYTQPGLQQKSGPANQVHAPYHTQTGPVEDPPSNGFIPRPSPTSGYQSGYSAPINAVVAPGAEHNAPRREENSSRSSQGSHLRSQPKGKWAKKDKKQHGQNGHNKHHGAGAARKDEEPKLTEEEKAREEEMRAMWANDRVATARVLNASTVAQPSPNALRRLSQQSVASQAHVSQDHKRMGAPKDGRPVKKETSILDALEMHLDQAPRPDTRSQPSPLDRTGSANVRISQIPGGIASGSLQRSEGQRSGPSTARARRASPVAPQRESAQDEPCPPQQRLTGGAQYVDPYAPGPAPLRPEATAQRYEPARFVPAQYRDAAAVVHRSDMHEPHNRGYRPENEFHHNREPRPEHPPQDYRHRSVFPEDVLPPPPRGQPTGQLYEIVEYIDDQGSYFVRRPIDRVPPAEPSYYDYPYATERPRPREQKQQTPIRNDRNGGSGHLPVATDGPYDVYERAPPSHRPIGEEEYGRAPAPPPQGRYWKEEYPINPSGSASATYGSGTSYSAPPQRHTLNERLGRRGYEIENAEEEYDPRYPAAPSSAAATAAGPKYQRRQVRYD